MSDKKMKIESIRTDCYLALLSKFRLMYPNAHFEVITSRSSSDLRPSLDLLIRAGIMKYRNGPKRSLMAFSKYSALFKKEIRDDPLSWKRLQELKELSKEKTVFLVCYEKDAAKCHRTLIKEMIEDEV